MEKQLHNGKNFGLRLEPRKPTDYHRIGGVFSPLVKGVLFPDGHGIGNYLPNPEIQKSDYDDWMDCVTESYTNCIETLLNIGNLNKTFSKRALAKLDGTTREGNSQGQVADTARKLGMVPEQKWPRDRSMNWDTYYSSIPQAIISLGTAFLGDFSVQYEYVGTDAQSLKEALKYGPVQVIGYAWAKDANGQYQDYGYPPNHAFMLYDFVDGQCWRIYDSYPADFIIDENETKQEFMKELAWDFHFGSALQMVVTPVKKSNTSLLTIIKSMIDTLVSWFDQHGLHMAYTPKDSTGKVIGKQVLNMDFSNQSNLSVAFKTLLKTMYDKGYFVKSEWASVSQIADLTADKMIK